jgi:competence protein ComEC
MKSLTFVGALAATLSAAAPAAGQTPRLQVVERSSASAANLPVIGPSTRDWMAAHLINVGQGAATLFEFSCGLVLVDTGGGAAQTGDWRARFGSYLDDVFARRPDLNRRLDVVVLTHPHSDHTLGVPLLTAPGTYRIGHVVSNAETRGSGFSGQNRLWSFAAAQNVGITRMKTSMLAGTSGLTNAQIDPLRCAGNAPDVRLLWGSSDPVRWASNGNNQSVVVRLDFGESSFLVVGDLEEDAQQALIERYSANPAILDIDVYQAGHHGSRNGTAAEFVRAMSPEIALIGAGDPSAREQFRFSAFNFGHPNRVAISLLSDPATGVSMRRPQRRVGVGVRGRSPNGQQPATFEMRDIDRAIFSTGWDGDVVVYASLSGEKRVLFGRTN